MSVAASISGALIRFGRQMTLQRIVHGTVQASVVVYGVTKGYEPHEMIEGSGLKQGDTKVTFTTAEIDVASWPEPPISGDRIIIDGKMRTIGSVEPKYLGTEILVYVCQVRG